MPENYLTALKNILQLALFEDIPEIDITSAYIIPENPVVHTKIITREKGVFFGKDIITTLMHMVSKEYQVTVFFEDGDLIQENDVIAVIQAPAHDILKAERILLNLIQHLSGIASLTQLYVKTLDDPKIHVMDTRKTSPGLRFLEKAAVAAGGGYNHRHSLSDMVLIKENHLYCLEDSGKKNELHWRIKKFKEENPNIKVEVEVETCDDLLNLDLRDADYILFDNFSIPELQRGLHLCDEKKYGAKKEVSGNITLENIRQYKGLDIHRISVGRLTHSAKALNFSLLLEKNRQNLS